MQNKHIHLGKYKLNGNQYIHFIHLGKYKLNAKLIDTLIHLRKYKLNAKQTHTLSTHIYANINSMLNKQIHYIHFTLYNPDTNMIRN